MKTTTNAQNQNSQQGGRDLGQIMVKPYHRTDGGKFDGWWCEVLNKDRYRIAFWEGNTQPSKADYIAWGYEWEDGYERLPITTWRLASALADLTSRIKEDRDYAKKKVRRWTETGKAVHALAMAEIDECKARNESIVNINDAVKMAGGNNG